MTGEDPVELLLADLDRHLPLLRSLADTLADEHPRVAAALDVSLDEIEDGAKRVRDHLALGDTAVLSIGDLAEPKP